ncbi:MAG: hypothetical protein KatS3mg096_760 [Candidatus Parcubacteria bacterium]|nr:MAG: hypothetical protein KatS3mg096_760 [Candidatus Parcubacteria bacterium]
MTTKNKKRIGDYYERRIKKAKEEVGYVCFKPARTKFSQKDIFGFDLLCWHPQWKILQFIQVKKNKKDFTKEVLKKLLFFFDSIETIGVQGFYFEKGKMKEIFYDIKQMEKTKNSFFEEGQFLSASEYAKLKKISRQAVHKQIKAGNKNLGRL